MAQSKKQQLKSIRRRCTQAGRALAYTAYTAGNVALLDTYGQLRQDIRETLQQFRHTPSGDLRDIAYPVTFQHVDQLRKRLIALQTQIIPFSDSGNVF